MAFFKQSYIKLKIKKQKKEQKFKLHKNNSVEIIYFFKNKGEINQTQTVENISNLLKKKPSYYFIQNYKKMPVIIIKNIFWQSNFSIVNVFSRKMSKI